MKENKISHAEEPPKALLQWQSKAIEESNVLLRKARMQIKGLQHQIQQARKKT
jgi:hypothetical protein